ncbi:metal-dependent hydrolase [Limnobacter sp.]|uniref:metal-dependent hydrolase n=1 Tax=Limnobacter sp. TaxID=2003368 RepID=UPI0035199235
MTEHSYKEDMVVRKDLDFGITSDDIPRYWMAGDPFKTRVFDGVQMTFPDGERYFISSVRLFKDQITDPEMKQAVRDFSFQEGQHGKVHSDYNDRLRKQGVPVDKMLAVINKIMQGRLKNYSASYNLAMTAAFEHFTAMMAEMFFSRKEVMAGADPRVRAMLAWHAIEEMEHKAVAFDVMQKVAKVGYGMRCLAMAHATFNFTLHTLIFTWIILGKDGFKGLQRAKIYGKGLWWLMGPKGVYTRLFPKLLSYYKPGFHPWQTETVHNYQAWLQTFNSTGNPVLAGEAMYEAAH